MKVKVLKTDVIKGSIWPEGSVLDESYLAPAEMQELIDQKRVVEIKGADQISLEPPAKEKKKS